MLPIQSPDNLFHDGVPGGELGTVLGSAWLNGVQAEVFAVLAAAGMVPAAANNQLLAAIQGGALTSGAATGSADALALTWGNSALAALKDRMTIVVMASFMNATMTPTFNLTLGATATGAKTIVKGANLPLAAGDIAGANHALSLTYSTALDKWILNNPANLGGSVLATNGWKKYPDPTSPTGYFIEQWGMSVMTAGASNVAGTGWINYPIVFPNKALTVNLQQQSVDNVLCSYAAAAHPTDAGRFAWAFLSASAGLTRNVQWNAKGY